MHCRRPVVEWMPGSYPAMELVNEGYIANVGNDGIGSIVDDHYVIVKIRPVGGYVNPAVLLPKCKTKNEK